MRIFLPALQVIIERNLEKKSRALPRIKINANVNKTTVLLWRVVVLMLSLFRQGGYFTSRLLHVTSERRACLMDQPPSSRLYITTSIKFPATKVNRNYLGYSSLKVYHFILRYIMNGHYNE
jgi:hypothetical protein